MGEISNILEDSIQSIEQTTDLFYQQQTDEGYKQLANTLTLLTDTMISVLTYKTQGNDIGIDEGNLNQALTNAMEAMEIKDTILLSDILQYEIKSLLEKVLSTI